MTDRPGHMWALVQEWLDTFTYRPPSQRELAPRLGVSNSTLGDYKYARHMPPPAFVVRLSREIQVPYEKVLDAVLRDRGYRGDKLAQVEESLDGAEAKLRAYVRDQRGDGGQADERGADTA